MNIYIIREGLYLTYTIIRAYLQYMKKRSSVTGKLIKMKVKKSSRDKEVISSQWFLSVIWVGREKGANIKTVYN